jgi:serine/threonine protein kinase
MALAHVHSLGIVHLDVKPANILIGADGSIRLADFGIAARVPANRRGGTPLFAAPEIFAGGAVLCAADAWSFGVVVYTLLVGFPPFFPHEGGRSADMKEQVSDSQTACSRLHALQQVAHTHRCFARAPQIKRGNFGFPLPYWSRFSSEVLLRGGSSLPTTCRPDRCCSQSKDFIKRLLVVDVAARMTVPQALEHPWLLEGR